MWTLLAALIFIPFLALYSIILTWMIDSLADWYDMRLYNRSPVALWRN